MGFKVLSAEISHETNMFSVHPTGIQALRDRYLLLGEQAIAARGRNNTELAGLLGAGRDHGSQFTSLEWASFLKHHGLEHSMSRRGNCHPSRA